MINLGKRTLEIMTTPGLPEQEQRILVGAELQLNSSEVEVLFHALRDSAEAMLRYLSTVPT